MRTRPPEINSNDFFGFWNKPADSNSNFVVAKIIFVKDSIFWCVQSSITHNVAVQWACAVACLHPHNSISNVVASVTINDDTHIYIYIYIFTFFLRNLLTYMSMYMSMFRDLESGLSEDLQDDERGLRRADVGGGSWRY